MCISALCRDNGEVHENLGRFMEEPGSEWKVHEVCLTTCWKQWGFATPRPDRSFRSFLKQVVHCCNSAIAQEVIQAYKVRVGGAIELGGRCKKGAFAIALYKDSCMTCLARSWVWNVLSGWPECFRRRALIISAECLAHSEASCGLWNVTLLHADTVSRQGITG